jgi:EmrB/QacA subfamily drug resistance transporter
MTRPWRVLLVVSVAVFLASLDLFIVNIAFPDLAADFEGTAIADLSWVLNGYTIVFAALLVPAGRLADRVGRRRVFLAGLLLFVAASALAATASSVEFLVGARVLQAAGAAALLPTSLALMLREFPPEKRAAAIGVWAAVGGVAAALGPPVGGLLVELSWRWIFVINIPLGLAAAIYGAVLLRESREADGAWPDALGTVALAAAIAGLSLALVKGPEWGWADVRVVGGFAASAVLLAGFLRRSARHPSPVVELPLLRVRAFAAANAAALLFFAAFAAMLLSTSLFLTQVWGYSVLEAGLALAPGPATAAVVAVPASLLAARVGPGRVAAAGGLLFAAAGAWWMWRVGGERAYAADYLPAIVVGGAGVGLTISPLSAAVAASLPPARFATGTGVLGMARQLGTVLGVAILVAILGDAAGARSAETFEGGWAFMTAAAAASAVAALLIDPVGAGQAEEPARGSAALAAERA